MARTEIELGLCTAGRTDLAAHGQVWQPSSGHVPLLARGRQLPTAHTELQKGDETIGAAMLLGCIYGVISDVRHMT